MIYRSHLLRFPAQGAREGKVKGSTFIRAIEVARVDEKFLSCTDTSRSMRVTGIWCLVIRWKSACVYLSFDLAEVSSQLNSETRNIQSVHKEYNEVIQRVKALDPDAMTEEEARLAGIPLLEGSMEELRLDSRFSLIYTAILALVLAVLFNDAGEGDISAFIEYRKAKRTLKKFKKGTYRKGYRRYLKDWQDKILRQEEKDAKNAAAAEYRALKKAEKKKKKPS